MKLLIITGLFCNDKGLLSPLEHAGLLLENVGTAEPSLSHTMLAGGGIHVAPVFRPQPLPDAFTSEAFNTQISRYLAAQRPESVVAWADPGTATLLENWGQPDPEIKFLFLYQPPWHALGQLLRTEWEAFQDSPETVADYWLDYNRALLHYYSRHRTSGLLVNSGYRESFHSGITAALNSHFGLELRHEAAHSFPAVPAEPRGHAIHAHLLGQVSPECIELYLELESCATLLGRQPYFDCQQQILTSPEASVFFGDWAAQLHGEQETAGRITILEGRLAAVETEKQSLRQQLRDLHLDGEQLRLKWNALRQEMEAKLKQLQDLKSAHQEVSDLNQELRRTLKEKEQEATVKQKEMLAKLEEGGQESELLLLQLHQVQEELEHYFLDNQRLESKQGEIQKSLELSNQQSEEKARQLEQSQQRLRDREQQLEQSRQSLQDREQQLEQGQQRLQEKEQQLVDMERHYNEARSLLDEYRETLEKARYSISALYKNRRLTPAKTLM